MYVFIINTIVLFIVKKKNKNDWKQKKKLPKDIIYFL